MQDAQDFKELKVPKWPFLLGDAAMLGLAYYIYWQGKLPLERWEIAALGVCVALGTLLSITPFLLEYRAVMKYGALIKLIETSSLCAATEKIQNLESCVAQISSASDQLQEVQTAADKTAGLAREITERMAVEVREFTAFMQKAGEGEKATLRLEVDKLRRAEGDWIGVLVFILDHVFALTRAGERSGRDNLSAQLNQFQAACRDAARRVGLVPLLAAPGDKFDAQKHQLPEGQTAPADATVGEIVAPGYTFQGRRLRSVLVRVAGDTPVGADPNASAAVAEGTSPQSQLTPGAAESPAT